MKSALFVDFDNVYTQLRALQPAAAERFARQPVEWMRWLVESLAIPEGHPNPGARRRMLVRRCYLNPNWYQQYRHAFLRAGFEIVDCPPVTSQGKTSTDIHMVLDIVELLAHETGYEEFIVLSADADFTPVLRKLRRYDRRTTVLAIGFPSAAYQASADLMIDERQFIEQALGLAPEPVAGPAGAPARPVAAEGTPPAADAAPAPDEDTAAAAGVAAAAMAATVGEGAAGAARADAARPLDAEELDQVAQHLVQLVQQAAQPLSAGTLASRLRQAFPQRLEQWNGHGSFKAFYRALGLPQLVWISGSGGRIADPARHALDPVAAEPDLGQAAGAAALWAGHEDLLPLAREICALTGAPLLAPPVLRSILDLLCADLATQPYEPAQTARRLCAEAAQRGLELAPRDVGFLLRGLQLNGHVFGQGRDDAGQLAQRLVNQLLFLCQREQMVVDEAMRAQVRQWIGGDLPVA